MSINTQFTGVVMIHKHYFAFHFLGGKQSLISNNLNIAAALMSAQNFALQNKITFIPTCMSYQTQLTPSVARVLGSPWYPAKISPDQVRLLENIFFF